MPAGHDVQEELPEMARYFPTSHGVHEPLPLVAAYEPIGQLVQDVEPATANDPTGQLRQAEADDAALT